MVTLTSNRGEVVPSTTGNFLSGTTTETIFIRANNNVTTPTILTAWFVLPEGGITVTGFTTFSLEPAPVLFVTPPTTITRGTPFPLGMTVYEYSGGPTMTNFADRVTLGVEDFVYDSVFTNSCLSQNNPFPQSTITPSTSDPFANGTLTQNFTVNPQGSTGSYCIRIPICFIGSPTCTRTSFIRVN
jgi:hypothetical protein